MTRPAAIPDGIAEAARWRLLGLLLERPRSGWRADVAAIAREVGDPVLTAASRLAVTADEGEYLALLGSGGTTSPREAAHGGLRDPGRVLAELAAHYDAFGYAPSAEDPPDHVAVEVGFVAYLHLKEALALSCGDDEAATTTRAARAAFLDRHLAPVAAALARALGGGRSYLAAVAAALAARVPPAPASGTGDADPLAGGCGACLGRDEGDA
jgi:nitrate reductase assembly molybdenum cofactor insertion protein NarJ